jgi:hypothetical protein
MQTNPDKFLLYRRSLVFEQACAVLTAKANDCFYLEHRNCGLCVTSLAELETLFLNLADDLPGPSLYFDS